MFLDRRFVGGLGEVGRARGREGLADGVLVVYYWVAVMTWRNRGACRER